MVPAERNAQRTRAEGRLGSICIMGGSDGALGPPDDLMVTKMPPEFLWGRKVISPVLDLLHSQFLYNTVGRCWWIASIDTISSQSLMSDTNRDTAGLPTATE